VEEVLRVGPCHGSPQSQAAILFPQQCLTPPRGRVRSRRVSREGDILQGVNSGPDPHGRAPDPRICSPDPQGWSRTPGYTVWTPKVGHGPPRVQARPLGWDPDPPVWGPSPHRGVPRSQEGTYTGLEQDPGSGPVSTRVQAQPGADLSAYASAPRPGGVPMPPRGPLCVT
jgi:hypothetical protein